MRYLIVFLWFFLMLWQGCGLSYAQSGSQTSVTPENRSIRPVVKKKDVILDDVTRWHAMAQFAGSFNNLGVQLELEGGYRWRLYPHPNLAFHENFFLMAAALGITPATLNVGAIFRLQPAAFFTLGVSYLYRVYFPAFSGGTLFKDISAVEQRFQQVAHFLEGEERIREQREEIERKNNGRVMFGAHILRLQGEFRFRFKGVIAVCNLRVDWFWAPFQDVDNSQYYYEAALDIVIKKEDVVLDMLAGIGYEWRSLRFLAATTYTKAFQSGEVRWGVGPAIQWAIARRWMRFRQPFLLGVVRWWVDHRFRVGPVPNVAVLLQTQFR